MEDKFAFDDMALPGTSSNRQVRKDDVKIKNESYFEDEDIKPFIGQIPDHETKYEFCSEDEDIKQEILDDMEFLDQDSMMGSEEESDAEFSEVSNRSIKVEKYDETFKNELIARILPEKRLRPQTSKNGKKMRIKKPQVRMKRFWLRRGFMSREGQFLAFHSVPTTTTVEDCSLLLEVCGYKESQDLSKLRPLVDDKYPLIAIAFEPHPTSDSFSEFVKRLQIAICEEILDIQGEHKIRIRDSYTEEYLLVLICENEATKSWLESIVPSLQVKNVQNEGYSKLVTHEVSEIPQSCIKIYGKIPDTKLTSRETILKILSEQNPPLNTNKWKVLDLKTSEIKSKSKEVILIIDTDTLPVLNKYNWILNYKGQKAVFRLSRGFRSLRFGFGKKKKKRTSKRSHGNENTQKKKPHKERRRNLLVQRQEVKAVHGRWGRIFLKSRSPYHSNSKGHVTSQVNHSQNGLQGIQRSNLQVKLENCNGKGVLEPDGRSLEGPFKGM